MQIFKPLIISLLFSVFVFTACIKDATNVDVPDFVPKLVVQGFISPEDTVIKIAISKNIRSYGDQTPPDEVKDATVLLSDSVRSVQMVYTKNGEYRVTDKSFKLKHNVTYSLAISTPEGLSAYAFCDIPKLEDWQVTLDTTLGYYYDAKRYGFKITDVPGKKNYYRVNALLEVYMTEIQKRVPVKDTIIDTLHHRELGYAEFDINFLTDWGADGKVFEVITNESLFNYKYWLGYAQRDSLILKFHLYNVDNDYYAYHKTISNYVPDDDPFGEPVAMHSNIQGGLGIFCSYAKKEYRFRIK